HDLAPGHAASADALRVDGHRGDLAGRTAHHQQLVDDRRPGRHAHARVVGTSRDLDFLAVDDHGDQVLGVHLAVAVGVEERFLGAGTGECIQCVDVARAAGVAGALALRRDDAGRDQHRSQHPQAADDALALGRIVEVDEPALLPVLQRTLVGREGPDLLVRADIDDVPPGEVAVLGRGSPPLHFAVVDDAVQALHLDGGQVALADEAAGAGEYPHVAGVRIAGQREAGGDRLRRVGVVARLEHGLARVGHLPVAAARTGQVELPEVALEVAGVDVVHAPVAVVVPATR